jgi:predicted nucleic acid-binding protein
LIYLDSCIVIYTIDDHPVWGPLAAAKLLNAPSGGFATSALVKAECMVRPFRMNDHLGVRAFEAAFAQMNTLPITEAIFIAAARLRATHGVKLPDALHLACAKAHGCSALWTNDDRLVAAAPGFTEAIV